ncbi:Isochorismatase hydrolase [Aspergillus sclerotiicarbonarius CBS 121057]|uniref:nicotinamidase n=1 Tax=Aspergillus sclerotiicarbonarius (strain CBS 121057 / IBT 28362) TaxID=1448318 RepID=A0A319E8S6_ASPSB|nr:Isochorismatase hydrolase [Aspergillus sclerotiicarbonarius CBS 121057]
MKAALIVVDMQEDFCPPNGSLAVQEARDLAPTINTLLAHPGFTLRIASQDSHPTDHISFAPNHPPPNNRPFECHIEMINPAPGKESQTKPQRLWPVHCVAGTEGAEIIPEIDTQNIDLYVQKGMDSRVEMYSAFADAFGNLDKEVNRTSVDVHLKGVLEETGITDVFCVGVAGDYCVKFTAIDAAKAGLRSYLVEDAVRCVDPGQGWEEAKRELSEAGVRVVRSDGPEVAGLFGSV